jgi:4-amino-4-deoxy-L-arabinose transferase-like glycosyltransferase
MFCQTEKKCFMLSKIKQIKKTQWFLLAIILLTILLRFVGGEIISPPLNRDEAALGYNAYSLLKTGQDEHGVSWPLSFESIGDYKMPGYIYLSMLPIKTLGLTVFAVRFCSALAGVLAVLGTYLLVRQIGGLLKFDKQKINYWALISSFLLTINPWHLHYSRIGFESNVNLTLFIWGILLFLKGIKNNWYLLVSSLLFVAMQFMYSSSFIFLPIFLIGMLGLTFKLKKTKWLKNNLALGLSLLLLIIGSFVAVKSVYQISKAKQAITIFSSPSSLDKFNTIRGQANLQNPLLAKLWYNKYLYFGRQFLGNYTKHFMPGFLFFNKIQHPWHAVWGHGFFYYFDGLLFLIGLIAIFKNIKKQKFAWLLILWLMLAPLASAITIDSPHATRSLFLIPIFIIIVGLGFVITWQYLSKKIFTQKILVLTLLLTIYFINFIRFSYLYIIKYPQTYDPALMAGIKPVVEYLQNQEDDRPIYFDQVSRSPYLYVLFYSKIDPLKVQQNSIWKQKDTAGLTHIEKLGKYNFVTDFSSVEDKAFLVSQNPKMTASGFFKQKEYINPRTGKIDWVIYKN